MAGYDPGARERRSILPWLAIAAVLALLGTGAWWYARHRTPPMPVRVGIDEVAAAAPPQAQAVLVVDGRDEVDVTTLVGALSAFEKQGGELGKQLGDLQAALGFKLAEVPAWLSPAGMVALVPVEGQKSIVGPPDAHSAELLACLAVTDEEAARKMLDRVVAVHNLKPREEERAGVKVRVLDHAAFALAYKRVWVASSAAALERGLRALSGATPSLVDDPRFVEARQRCPSSKGTMAWVDVRNAAATLNTLPGIGPYVDGQTVQALTAIDYVAVTADPLRPGQEARLFVKIDPKTENAFARALLDGRAVGSSATLVPARWGSCVTLSAPWAGAVGYQGALLLPFVRSRLGSLPTLAGLYLGFDPVAAFQGATMGDVVLTCDALKSLSAGGRPTVLCMLPLKDARAAETLIEKLEKKLHHGSRTVARRGDLDIRTVEGLDLLWTISAGPTPLLLVARGPEAEARMEEAAKKPDPSVGSLPEVQALTREARGQIVETDWNDLTPLVRWATGRLSERPAAGPAEKAARAWCVEHLKGIDGCTVTSMVTVEADGLTVRSRALGSVRNDAQTGSLTVSPGRF